MDYATARVGVVAVANDDAVRGEAVVVKTE